MCCKCYQTKSQIKLSGTSGYAAPEYLLDGKLTEKSDVHAFGMVVLELLIGRKPVENLSRNLCQTVVSWTWPLLRDQFPTHQLRYNRSSDQIFNICWSEVYTMDPFALTDISRLTLRHDLNECNAAENSFIQLWISLASVTGLTIAFSFCNKKRKEEMAEMKHMTLFEYIASLWRSFRDYGEAVLRK